MWRDLLDPRADLCIFLSCTLGMRDLFDLSWTPVRRRLVVTSWYSVEESNLLFSGNSHRFRPLVDTCEVALDSYQEALSSYTTFGSCGWLVEERKVAARLAWLPAGEWQYRTLISLLGSLATMRRVVNYHSSWARQRQGTQVLQLVVVLTQLAVPQEVMTPRRRGRGKGQFEELAGQNEDRHSARSHTHVIDEEEEVGDLPPAGGAPGGG
ncbi:hypothetical protein F511_29860 [Dorcoceras hygrometricum]|uniref:Uncharacterized protein n=1 Tax=Dorcoceras hygrometricum TaxID=472368 RepID=A0A2Z7CD77_9LAMI|nr:hypothetical protein F511_29860 [Dorcoceras hygrometricum]